MDNPVQDAQVVESPVEVSAVPSNIDVILSQQANFKSQLEQVKANMTKYQQAFEAEKVT